MLPTSDSKVTYQCLNCTPANCDDDPCTLIVDVESDYPMHCPYSKSQEPEWIIVNLEHPCERCGTPKQVIDTQIGYRCPECFGKEVDES